MKTSRAPADVASGAEAQVRHTARFAPAVRALGRHIGLILAIKVVAILVLFLAFFSPWWHRPDIDRKAMDRQLTGGVQEQTR